MNIFISWKKGAASVLLGLSLLGLSGVTTNSYAEDNEKFCDSYGEYRLILRNNDLYLEKLENNESRIIRQITHTPSIEEIIPKFSKDGKCLLYGENWYADVGKTVVKFYPERCYRVSFDKDDSDKKLISYEEYKSLSGVEDQELE